MSLGEIWKKIKTYVKYLKNKNKILAEELFQIYCFSTKKYISPMDFRNIFFYNDVIWRKIAVLLSLHSWSPDYFPPYILVENRRGTHSWVECVGHSFLDQTTADALQFASSTSTQMPGSGFHEGGPSSLAIGFSLGSLHPEDAMSSPHWLNTSSYSDVDGCQQSKNFRPPFVGFCFSSRLVYSHHTFTREGSWGNRFSQRWSILTAGSTSSHGSKSTWTVTRYTNIFFSIISRQAREQSH